MPDLSDQKQPTIALVISNLLARGWAGVGVGAVFGLTLADLFDTTEITEDLTGEAAHSLGMAILWMEAMMFFVLPGIVLSIALALVRRFAFPRVVWGNAHWIFPGITASVGFVAGILLGFEVV